MEGFAERKMILILDVYDQIKRVKKHLKIKDSLAHSSNFPYASDISKMNYQVINHRKGEAIECEFTINPTS